MLSRNWCRGTVQKLSSKMVLSVSEEMTQQTGEMQTEGSQRQRWPNTGWQGIPDTCSSHRECLVAESGSAGGWFDECWHTDIDISKSISQLLHLINHGPRDVKKHLFFTIIYAISAMTLFKIFSITFSEDRVWRGGSSTRFWTVHE